MAHKRENDTFRLGDIPEELGERGRDVWLAGLGALATVEEEGSKLFNSLVQRGEKFEERGKEAVDEAVDEGARQMVEAADELGEQQREASESVGESTRFVQDLVSGTVQMVMDRFDVPSRHEVQGLAERVELLSKQIDELSISLERKQQGTAAEAEVKAEVHTRTTYHVQPREDDWAVMREGAEQASSTHETKKEAVESGRELAKNNAPSLLVLHKQDGSIQDEISYAAESEG